MVDFEVDPTLVSPAATNLGFFMFSAFFRAFVIVHR